MSDIDESRPKQDSRSTKLSGLWCLLAGATGGALDGFVAFFGSVAVVNITWFLGYFGLFGSIFSNDVVWEVSITISLILGGIIGGSLGWMAGGLLYHLLLRWIGQKSQLWHSQLAFMTGLGWSVLLIVSFYRFPNSLFFSSVGLGLWILLGGLGGVVIVTIPKWRRSL